MKIFGAINDGYRFIYSEDETIVQDWLYVNQEHFCILKVFSIDVAENTIIKQDSDLHLNYCFDKRNIPQEIYKKCMNEELLMELGVVFNQGIAYLEEIQKNSEALTLKLNYEEKIILKATRNYQER